METMIYQSSHPNHHHHHHQSQNPNPNFKTLIPKPKPPIGLKNLGNTCYLNSVLQCLTYTPPLSHYSHSSLHSCTSSPKSCPFCLLQARITRSLSLSASSDAPYRIYKNLAVFSSNFSYNRQEDAHEFLRYVIDACVVSGEKAVKEIFGGELRSQVKCVECGGESNKVDEIMDLSLDLWRNVGRVTEALDRFFEVEVLNGSNKYRCDKCEKLVVAKKQMTVLKAPNVLVIQLKRFEGIHGVKIDRAITFEECLVLSKYMCKESQDPHPEYNLFGTIVHSGYSQESGHYYAYVKDTVGRWYCCNDSIVSLSSLQEVLSEKVYILFFTRSNKKLQPPKSLSFTNGAKPVHSNGYGAQHPKEADPPKSVLIGPHNSEKVIPTISKSGKVPSSPRIKFANLTKEHHGNGNGTSNGYAKNQMHMKDTEKVMNKDRPLVTSTDGATANGYASAPGSESKQNFSLPHGNGKSLGSCVKPTKTEKSENGGLVHNVVANGRRHDSGVVSQNEDSCTISRSKRKASDHEPNFSPTERSRVTVEKITEALGKDASSGLKSCGWYDEVYNFMIAKKKLCAQTCDITTSDIELKKLLIAKAKQTFIPQVPAPLKAHLIKSLESCQQLRQLFDS